MARGLPRAVDPPTRNSKHFVSSRRVHSVDGVVYVDLTVVAFRLVAFTTFVVPRLPLPKRW